MASSFPISQRAARAGRNENTSETIAKNTLWSGTENLASLATGFATSVLVARAVGPASLGSYSFFVWITAFTATLGSLGLPMTTRKYMAEYLGRGEPGVAREVFFNTLRLQAFIATAIACVGSLLTLMLVPPPYRLISVILFASIIPQMVANIPSQANNAIESFGRNVPGALLGMAVYVAGVLLSLAMGLDLLGVALSTLLAGITELAVKTAGVLRWVNRLPVGVIPEALRKRMLAFSGAGFALTALSLVVWERSDVLLLKLLQSDMRQIAFFSLSFSLVDKILLVPNTLAGAMGASLMAEHGRSLDRTFRITELTFKYTLMCGLPMLVGLSVISAPLIRLVYGPAYQPACSILAVITLFAAAKCVLNPAQTLYLATEKLGLLLWVTAASGVVNILLDVALVPRYGAMGAAFGNGAAQAIAAAVLWRQIALKFHLTLDGRSLFRLAVCCAGMAAASLPFAVSLRPLLAVPLAIAVGSVAFLISARLTSLVTLQDRERLVSVSCFGLGSARVTTWLAEFVHPGNPRTPNSAKAPA